MYTGDPRTAPSWSQIATAGQSRNLSLIGFNTLVIAKLLGQAPVHHENLTEAAKHDIRRL
jgi:hypothetical protein